MRMQGEEQHEDRPGGGTRADQKQGCSYRQTESQPGPTRISQPVDRQIIWTGHIHCGVCGAVTRTFIYDDATMDFEMEMHDFDTHVEAVNKAKAAQWN